MKELGIGELSCYCTISRKAGKAFTNCMGLFILTSVHFKQYPVFIQTVVLLLGFLKPSAVTTMVTCVKATLVCSHVNVSPPLPVQPFMSMMVHVDCGLLKCGHYVYIHNFLRERKPWPWVEMSNGAPESSFGSHHIIRNVFYPIQRLHASIMMTNACKIIHLPSTARLAIEAFVVGKSTWRVDTVKIDILLKVKWLALQQTACRNQLQPLPQCECVCMCVTASPSQTNNISLWWMGLYNSPIRLPMSILLLSLLLVILL